MHKMVEISNVKAVLKSFEGMKPVVMVKRIEADINASAEPREGLEALFDSKFVTITFPEPVFYHEAEAAVRELVAKMLGISDEDLGQ